MYSDGALCNNRSINNSSKRRFILDFLLMKGNRHDVHLQRYICRNTHQNLSIDAKSKSMTQLKHQLNAQKLSNIDKIKVLV
jgi:hypothetical protein